MEEKLEPSANYLETAEEEAKVIESLYSLLQ